MLEDMLGSACRRCMTQPTLGLRLSLWGAAQTNAPSADACLHTRQRPLSVGQWRHCLPKVHAKLQLHCLGKPCQQLASGSARSLTSAPLHPALCCTIPTLSLQLQAVPKRPG